MRSHCLPVCFQARLHNTFSNIMFPFEDSLLFSGSDQLKDEAHAFHPAGRVGTVEDIANLVAFLADNAQSGFITGHKFIVDGGATRKMIYPE